MQWIKLYGELGELLEELVHDAMQMDIYLLGAYPQVSGQSPSSLSNLPSHPSQACEVSDSNIRTIYIARALDRCVCSLYASCCL